MKKLIALVSALVCVLGLAGCSDKNMLSLYYCSKIEFGGVVI